MSFKPQQARPETCCLRCWSLIQLNGYQWMRRYSTRTSTCGTTQLRWRRWVGGASAQSCPSLSYWSELTLVFFYWKRMTAIDFNFLVTDASYCSLKWPALIFTCQIGGVSGWSEVKCLLTKECEWKKILDTFGTTFH